MVALAPIANENAPLASDQFLALLANGGFGNAHVELLRGEVVFRMGQGSLHVHTLMLVLRELAKYNSDGRLMGSQSSLVATGDSVPEPDAFVMRFDRAVVPAQYTLADALLVVEVADSSLRRDRQVKAGMYAEAGVPEYWIVNPVARQVEVYRKPRGANYADLQVKEPGNKIAPTFAPGQETEVSLLLP